LSADWPSAAAKPVSGTLKPILISASAGPAASKAKALATAIDRNDFRGFKAFIRFLLT
jgi:hypothetical protein